MLKDLEFLTNLYFTFDKPVPFKEGLFIYPVKIKDYYEFFGVVDILMLDKNDDPKTIPMSYLKFIQYLSQQENGAVYNMKLSKLLELTLHIENGFYCPDCGYEIVEKKIIEELNKLGQNTKEKSKKFYELRLCHHCSKIMYDIIRYVEEERNRVSLYIKNTKLHAGDFDRLKDIILYQNISDYEDDSMMDSDLAADIKKLRAMKNAGMEDATLERKLACAVVSSGYTFETIQEITLRKLRLLLSVEDAKMFYQATKIGAMSGMVTFKTEPEHWIYQRKKTLFDEGATALDDLKKKIDMVN